jgi:hypothetical protein
MRKRLILCLFLASSAAAQTQIGGGGGGASSPTSITANTDQPVLTNLMAAYYFKTGENACSPTDYSGNGNTGTGCVGAGTATIVSNTGGLQCPGNGGVTLPAGLNSAATIQIQWNYQPSGQGNQAYLAVLGNGTPASSGVGVGVQQGPSSGQPTALGNNFSTYANNFGGGNVGFNSRATYIAGIEDVTLVMDATLDVLYFNGLPTLGGTTGNSAGKMSTGVYQLCGTTAGAGMGQTNYWPSNGQILSIFFYSGELNPAQVYQNHVFMQNQAFSRGINPLPFRNDTADAIWAYGDSVTQGINGVPWSNRAVGLNGTWNPINTGRSGNSANLLNIAAPVSGDSVCSTSGGRTAMVLLTGSANTGVVQDDFANTRAILQARKFLNCSKPMTILSTAMPIGNNTAPANTYKNALNLLERTNCINMADYCIDLGETVALGADGASASAVYFQADHIHPTQAGFDVLTWVYQRGINRYFGNHDLTTANVYTSAAAAAVAISAASEAGNVMTFTTAANTFVKGQCIVVTGVTPTTYNSTFANGAGLGCWYALSVTGTSFTAFNLTSGLGAGTIFGTAVAQQQQDADQWYIVNFGAGNTTLQPCDGLTVNDLQRITNINGVASTLVPFGTQTITGTAAPTTLAANTTAVLQAQLVSPVAGGCNWIRIQ